MWIGGCGSQPAPVPPTPISSPPKLEEAEAQQPAATLFGQVIDGTYKRQSRFELTERTIYGWRIKLPCTGPTLFRETLRLPAPGEWTFDPLTAEHVTVSDDQRRVVTEDYSGCFDGWIQHAWKITAGAPPGEYVMSVEIDGYQPQVFHGRFYTPEDFEKLSRRR